MLCSVCQLPVAEAIGGSEPSSNSRECPFCQAVFSRVDGARRHAKSCPKRDGRELRSGKRGRKTRSCDQCSRVKVHCTSKNQSPCDRCIVRQLECTFSRYCADVTHRKCSSESPSQLGTLGDNRASLSFILNVTDDKMDFVTERAVGEEPDAALLGPTRVTPPQVQDLGDETFGFIDPVLLLSCESQMCVTPLELGGLYNSEEQNLLGAFLTGRSQDGRLSSRLELLELDVADHARSLDHHGDPFDLIAFRRFFCVSNVHTFAMIYCRKRHYQYPIIHWPTFALEEASLPLLMVVSLTGATYSYRPGHGEENVTEARKLYHLADSYVFRQLSLYLDRPSSTDDKSEAIQICQAALLMYALDTLLAGDPSMQQIAVTQRLPALISAMRRLNFIGCRHGSSEDWQLFLYHEKIIRLVSWAFCADCLATLSCNRPPAFSLSELSGDIPYDNLVWDADSELAFEQLRSSHMGPSHCIRDLMSGLLEDRSTVDVDWERLPLFHLHVMLCAFQPIVFNLHVTMSLAQRSEKLLEALGTWRHFWGRCMERIPISQCKWLGVSKHVPDLEHLTKRIIEVAVSPEASSSRYLQRVPSCSAREMHKFIQEFILKT